MAAKRHHSSKKHMSKARYHEHSGMERAMHGLHHSYDTLRHERDEFNDEHHNSKQPEGSGPYMYDRTSKSGMERAVHRARGMMGHYEGAEPRRRQEMADAGMIYEDHEEIANLPQQVMMKKYPKTGPYLPEVLDDTIDGVDRQMDYDDDKRRENFYPKKV